VKCAVDLHVVEWQDVYVTTGLRAGREKKIADIHVRHPSCSSQHAVLQYRQVKDPKTGKTKVRPYIMDLQSTNGAFKAKGDGLQLTVFPVSLTSSDCVLFQGTRLNKEPIEASRYIELRENDLLNFGNSTRDYILLKISGSAPE